MMHYVSVGGGTYRHPHLRCRVVKPRCRYKAEEFYNVGIPWHGLFYAVPELRRAGYAVHSVYRLAPNHWLVITTEGWF
jgi:hypothetical protein